MSSTATVTPPRKSDRARNSDRESVHRVYSGMRERILSGQLIGGSIVSQVKIADEFSVSRSPVREAIRMLENEGLVEAQTNHRGRIATFSAADMEEVCALLVLNVAAAIVAGGPTTASGGWDGVNEGIDRVAPLGGVGVERAEGADDLHTRQLAFRHLIGRLCAGAGDHVRGIIDGLLDRIGMFRQLHESGRGRTPYPLAEDFSDLRQAVASADARAAALALVAKIEDVSTKALQVVEPDHRPTMLEAYANCARRLAGGAVPGTAAELTLRVRAAPGGGLDYTVDAPQD